MTHLRLVADLYALRVLISTGVDRHSILAALDGIIATIPEGTEMDLLRDLLAINGDERAM